MARGRSLEGGQWNLRLSPIKGELLSSWLLRFAKEYQKPPIVIVQRFSQANLGVLRNPDLGLKSEILHKIAIALKKPPEKIEGASLAKMATNIGLDITKKQIKPYWLVAARRGQGHQLASLPIQYCPQCLSQDEIPYFRKEWAFAFVVACKEHRSMLSQACPHCGTRDYYSGSWSAPTGMHLVNTVKHCLNCRGDLTDQKVSTLGGEYASLFQFQTALIKGAEEGKIKFGGFEGPANKLFRWLGEFARWIARRKSNSYLAKYLEIRRPKIPILVGRKIRIEHWAPSQRLILMHYCSELFSHWPVRFLALTNEAKLRHVLGSSLESALAINSRRKLINQENVVFTRSRKVWKEADINLIRTLAGQGKQVDEIAKQLKRTVIAIRSQASEYKIRIGNPRKVKAR